jgi:thioredoxin 1
MITVYYFKSDVCNPCIATNPHVEELERDTQNVKFQKIDVYDNGDLVNKFGINITPTFILIENGKEVKRISGPQTAKTLVDFIGGM